MYFHISIHRYSSSLSQSDPNWFCWPQESPWILRCCPVMNRYRPGSEPRIQCTFGYRNLQNKSSMINTKIPTLLLGKCPGIQFCITCCTFRYSTSWKFQFFHSFDISEFQYPDSDPSNCVPTRTRQYSLCTSLAYPSTGPKRQLTRYYGENECLKGHAGRQLCHSPRWPGLVQSRDWVGI